MLQWPWRWCTSSLRDFVMVVNGLKTRRDWDILQHQKPKRMLKEWAKSFDQTSYWLLVKFMRIWTSLMVPFRKFRQQIWTWGKWVRNLFRVFWQLNKSNSIVNFVGVVRLCCFRFQLSRNCHHLRCNFGLWLWSWDHGSEFSMEIIQFSCEKSVSIKIQNQSDDDCVFWPSWNCASWVCTQEYYRELWMLYGLVRVFKKQCVENDLRNG